MAQTSSRSERVPAEQRVLGMDRRTFPGAFFVLAVFLLFAVVVPRIDAGIPWTDPVITGDEFALTESIVFTPATGWNVAAGHRLTEDGSVSQSGDATLTSAGLELDVTTGAFDGTPQELLAQIDKVTEATVDPAFRVDGTPSTVRTDTGETGALQQYTSVTENGVIAAFVIDGTGVKVTAHGSPAQMQAATQQISDMISSIRTLDTKDAS